MKYLLSALLLLLLPLSLTASAATQQIQVPVSAATLSCSGGFDSHNYVEYADLWLSYGGQELSAPFGTGPDALAECKQVRKQVLKLAVSGILNATLTTESHHVCGGQLAPDACWDVSSRTLTLLDASGAPIADLDDFQ